MPTGSTIEARLTLNARQFTNAVEKARNQVINLADEALKASKKQSIAINNLVTAYSGVSTTIRRVKNTQDAMRASLDRDIEAIKKYGANSKEVDKLSKAFSINELNIKDLTNQMKRLTAEGDQEIQTAKRMREQYKGFSETLNLVSSAGSTVAGKLERLLELGKRLARSNRELTATQRARLSALTAEHEKYEITKAKLKAARAERERELRLANQSAQAHLKSAKAMGAEIGVIQQSQNAILKRAGALVKEAQAEEREREKLKQTEAALKANTTARRSNLAAIRAHLSAIQKSTHSFGTFSKAIGTSITLWYTFRTAIYAVKRAFEEVISIYQKGVEVTDDFRLAVISSSAIMAGSIREGTTAAEKMSLALGYNVEMFKKLELVAARHISTGKAVRDVYEGLIIARIYPGKEDVENIAKLADFITLYTKGQRLEIQLMQEVRGLMDGQVRAQNKLAYTLDRILNGKLKEHIRLWRNAGTDASGQLIILKEITRLLGDVGTLQGEILGTAKTWENTLTTIAERLLRDSIIGYYRDYKDLVQGISEYMFDLTEEYYTQEGLLVKGIIEQGWERLKDIVRGFVGSELTDMREIATKLLEDMSKWIRTDAKSFIEFGKSLRTVFDGIVFLVKNLKAILTSILVLAIPAWGVKILQVVLAVLSGASGTAAALISWIPILGAILYNIEAIAWNVTGLADDTQRIDLATASLGEAMEATSRPVKDLMEGYQGIDIAAASLGESTELWTLNAEYLKEEVEYTADAMERAAKQSKDFLYELQRLKNKQVGINDVYANFTEQGAENQKQLELLVGMTVDGSKQMVDVGANFVAVLDDTKRITELLAEVDEDYRKSSLEDIMEQSGLLVTENMLLREQARLREKIQGLRPTFERRVSADPDLANLMKQAKQKTEKLSSDIRENILKIIADTSKAEYEAQGKRVEAARIAMHWEMLAFEKMQEQKKAAFVVWATNNIKDEQARAIAIFDFNKEIDVQQAIEKKNMRAKLEAEISRLIFREDEKRANERKRVTNRYNEWRVRDERAAQERINKLKADIAIRGQQQVISKEEQARIVLAKRIVDIQTEEEKRIHEATVRLVDQYGTLQAASSAIANEKARITSETRLEMELEKEKTAQYIQQVRLLEQQSYEKQVAAQEDSYSARMMRLAFQREQLRWRGTPREATINLENQHALAVKNTTDQYGKLIAAQQDVIDKSAEGSQAWTNAHALIAQYNIDMISELSAMNTLFSEQMGKTRLQEAQGWASVAEMGVGNIAEMFRLMAQHNKKYFKWYQVFATGQILISTAMAIMKVWEVFAAVPPIAAALTATIGALAAAQIGVVWAQEPPQEMAAGGVRESGFGGLYGAYNRPTYMIAEAGAPEAVVPLDKYDISKKDSMAKAEVHHHYHINALDPAAWADFARRNPGPFREQFTTAIEENDPAVRGAVQAAAR